MRHIYHNIISVENLLISWREFLRGKKKRKDVAEFLMNFTDNISALHQELANKNYRHGGYQAFKINDPKPRDIHKASVRDRLVHHAVCRILYPYFERQFIFDSYSCRLGKGTHRAMNRFRDFARIVSRNHTKTVWVLKCDIRKFFASIDHIILKDILAKHIGDRDVLWLLSGIIGSFTSPCPLPVSSTGQALERERRNENIGLPLGNLTSQLLVNIYMNEFDQIAKRELKSRYYIRYADDFLIVHQDKNYLENFISKISEFLYDKLDLSLNPDKVNIKTMASGVDFLGWVHFPYHRVLRTSTKQRMLRHLEREFTSEIVASYSGLLLHGNAHKLTMKLAADFHL